MSRSQGRHKGKGETHQIKWPLRKRAAARIVSANLDCVARVLPPHARQMVEDKIPRTHVKRASVKEIGVRFAHPQQTPEARGRHVTQSDPPPIRRPALLRNLSVVRVRSPIVPQHHRRERFSRFALNQDAAAALRGKAYTPHLVPTRSGLRVNRTQHRAQQTPHGGRGFFPSAVGKCVKWQPPRGGSHKCAGRAVKQACLQHRSAQVNSQEQAFAQPRASTFNMSPHADQAGKGPNRSSNAVRVRAKTSAGPPSALIVNSRPLAS